MLDYTYEQEQNAPNEPQV